MIVLSVCRECGDDAARGCLLCDGCCAHEDVETSDEADGREGGLPHEWVSRCIGCGQQVVPDEDGWEVAR